MQQDLVQIHLYTIQPDSNIDGKGQLSTSGFLNPDPKKSGFLCPLNFTQLGSLDSSLKHWEGVLQTIIGSIEKIKSYAEIANELWIRPSKENSVQTHVPKIFILLVSAKDFTTKQGSSNADKKLTKIISYFRHTCLAQEGEEILAEHSFDYQPIITIGVEDLMSLYSEDETPTDFRRALNLDHRIKYLDSSIWNHYLPLHGDDPSLEPFAKRFLEIIQQMVTWHREGLYQSVAAVTTLEFQTRMLYNSFIAKVGEKGHNELVRPFKFHSETQMRRKANEIMKFFEADRNGVTLKAMLKWNFLLVDDQAENVTMSTINNVHSSSVTKAKLIREILKADFPSSSIHLEVPKQEIGIVDEMIDKLKPDSPTVFDVILLDYLLGLGKEREREYGHDFLLRLRKEPALQKGPYNRFWIFPISSFPHAFTDKLQQLGINHLTDWWHLSNGGDPVCAPELFRYNMLEFLLQQVSVCFYDEDMLIKNMKKFSGIKKFDTWLESIERIILHIQAYRDQMNRKTGSLFCTSFLGFLDTQMPIKILEKEWLNFLGKCAKETIKEDVLDLIEFFLQKHERYRSVFPTNLGVMLDEREKRFKVFIHYSGFAEDLFYLQSLEQSLKSVKTIKIELWYPESSALPGDELEKVTADAIAKTDFHIVLVSNDLLANDKKYTELKKIYKDADKVITILCRKTIIDPKLQKQIQSIVPLDKNPISHQKDKDEAMNEAVLLLLEKIENFVNLER